jgi:alkanesulfonate monooxygenase SsuD/methylene tetrahydromethanopterin reductase-like flavin-dependent oxidoreductase (luciferase family)
MQFGLFGAAQAQRGGPDVDSAAGFKDYIEYVIEAETLGYQSAFIVEHHFTGFGQVSATLNLLTWIGARTRTLRLGTAVIVLPWHNPVLLAEQAATVDLLSGGRLDFGIGKGYRHNEFVGFRIPMEEAEPRFEEAIDIITKSWTSNERFSTKANTGNSTTSSLSRRQFRSRTRRSGRAPGIPSPSGGWHDAGTICCSTSSHHWMKPASGSPCIVRRCKQTASLLIRRKSASREPSM